MNIFSKIHNKSFFNSYDEILEFEKNLHDCIEKRSIIEVPVNSKHKKIGEEEERWFYDEATQILYKYIPPNFPAKGVWAKVP
jgi:hypothetical protein